MVAPVVAALVAFLSGAGGGVYGAPWLVAATKAEAGAAIAYADLRKGCAIAQPLLDIAAAARPKSAGLKRIAHLSDVICADVALADTPVNQLKLAADIVDALRKTPAVTTPAAQAPARLAPQRCGRNWC